MQPGMLSDCTWHVPSVDYDSLRGAAIVNERSAAARPSQVLFQGVGFAGACLWALRAGGSERLPDLVASRFGMRLYSRFLC